MILISSDARAAPTRPAQSAASNTTRASSTAPPPATPNTSYRVATERLRPGTRTSYVTQLIEETRNTQQLMLGQMERSNALWQESNEEQVRRTNVIVELINVPTQKKAW